MAYVNEYLDLCDRCKAVYGEIVLLDAGEHYYNWKAGRAGYSKWGDLCLDCAHELGLDNCGECGGVLHKSKLVEDPYPRCPSCRGVTTRTGILEEGFYD